VAYFNAILYSLKFLNFCRHLVFDLTLYITFFYFLYFYIILSKFSVLNANCSYFLLFIEMSSVFTLAFRLLCILCVCNNLNIISRINMTDYALPMCLLQLLLLCHTYLDCIHIVYSSRVIE